MVFDKNWRPDMICPNCWAATMAECTCNRTVNVKGNTATTMKVDKPADNNLGPTPPTSKGIVLTDYLPVIGVLTGGVLIIGGLMKWRKKTKSLDRVEPLRDISILNVGPEQLKDVHTLLTNTAKFLPLFNKPNSYTNDKSNLEKNLIKYNKFPHSISVAYKKGFLMGADKIAGMCTSTIASNVCYFTVTMSPKYSQKNIVIPFLDKIVTSLAKTKVGIYRTVLDKKDTRTIRFLKAAGYKEAKFPTTLNSFPSIVPDKNSVFLELKL